MSVILYVEDDEKAQHLVKKMLRHMGYNIIFALEGEEALRLARRQKPILILMDYHLPGMDGLEATKRMKDDSDLHSIPIVALTSDLNSRFDFEDAGADAYLNKPVRRGVLLRTITQMLNASDDV